MGNNDLKKRLVIFDLDGTLLNTITDLGMATNAALEANGFPTHNLNIYPKLVGNGVRKLIERALPSDTIDEAMLEKVLADFKAYYNEHNTDYTKPYDGIVELIDALSDAGVKIAIASNKYQEAVEQIVGHYFPGDKITVALGQRAGVPVKPDPSIVFDILMETGVPKSETLYVGDSGVDMLTAYRACVDSVGVTWGFRPLSELRANHATFVVDNASDILEIVNDVDLERFV